MIVWTKEAEKYFREKWPGIECARVAGEEASYTGERLSKEELKKPGSVAHEWLQLGWIEWKEIACKHKRWKPGAEGYEDYLRERWEKLQCLLGRDDIRTLGQVALKLGLQHSGALNFFLAKHGAVLAKKYGKLPRPKLKSKKLLSTLWTELME